MTTGYEVQMYRDITRAREALEKLATESDKDLERAQTRAINSAFDVIQEIVVAISNIECECAALISRDYASTVGVVFSLHRREMASGDVEDRVFLSPSSERR